MSKIVVFDFDGTLSYKDSMKELFKEQMTGFKKVYLIYYLALKVLAKFKITTVKFEKERMLKLLFHSKVEAFRTASKKQAESFDLNPIINRVKKHIELGDKVIVLSASSMYFLEEIFQGLDVQLIGTVLRTQSNTINGIERHPFSEDKIKCLKAIGVFEIDEMYYDSQWDECLIPMCKEWHRVKDGRIVYNGIRNVSTV